MIIDYLENIGTYRPILPGVDAGLKAAAALGEDPAVGRYEFEGGYFMVQEGETRPVSDGDFEAHRKYIDVQIILKGQELVAWADTSLLEISVPYDEAKDKIMYSGEPAQCNVIKEKMVWAAFPNDAHKACRELDTRAHYKKIVMKLPVG